MFNWVSRPTDRALKAAKTRQHVAVARIGSHSAVGVSSQAGRCNTPQFCAHVNERQSVATRHAEMQAVWTLMQRWGPTKFARKRRRLQVWSYAFVYNPETSASAAPRLVGARPCRSCARALHHLGVRHVHHSTDEGAIETVAVATLLDVAPLSLGERQLAWKADCERLATAEARGPLCTLWVNRAETFRFLQTGAKTEEWRCVFPTVQGAARAPKRRGTVRVPPPVDPTETHSYKLRTPLYLKQRKADRDTQQRAKATDAALVPAPTKRFDVRRVHAGEVLWVAHKAERVAMLVEHVRVDKQTTVRGLMARRGCWARVVPDAKDLDEAARRYTEGCYAAKGRPFRHVCARVYQFRLRPLQLSLRAGEAV
jgi:hypothetical protein